MACDKGPDELMVEMGDRAGDRVHVEVEPSDEAKRIVELEQELETTRDRMLRCAADFDNYRKRAERERLDYQRAANEGLLRDLLPVADALDRAIVSVGQADAGGSVVEGLRLVRAEVERFLRNQSTEPIQAIGLAFDPQVHEAVQMVEDSDAPDNTIVEEIRKGYLHNGRILRASLVVVARNPAPVVM